MVDEENLIAYCGLFCGDCFMHRGSVADLARDLRKELRSVRFDKTAEALSEISFFGIFGQYPECYDVLGAMVKLRCPKGCRDGGGNPHCKIRKCCLRKSISGCWLCDEFETCDKLDFLKANHGAAHIKNLRKLRQKGADVFLKGKKYWYA